jgi:hypothetical protein
MEIPAALSERFPFLDALEENWEPVSRGVFFGWLVFYALLIGNALFAGHLFQWFDLVFVPIHEGGAPALSLVRRMDCGSRGNVPPIVRSFRAGGVFRVSSKSAGHGVLRFLFL